MITLPVKVPPPGFYYHYKHDQSGPVNNYAYEVVGIGFHTEDDARLGEEHFMIYRPLYEASVYKVSRALGIDCLDARPLKMWMGEVEKDGRKIPRFTFITDPKVNDQLTKICDEMYN